MFLFRAPNENGATISVAPFSFQTGLGGYSIMCSIERD